MVMLEPRSSGREGRDPAAGGLDAGGRRGPWILALALLVICAYAIFAHGAIQAPAEPRVQVAVAIVAAVVAAAAALWTSRLRLAVPRLAAAGFLLLAGFAVWSGISLLWSVAPNLTWLEFNRNVAYATVLGLGVLLGASSRRALPILSTGFLVLAVAVTLYALGQKLVPGLRVSGLINLDQTGRIARLQEPLGYWNGLALLIAMAAPVALAIGGRQDLAGRWRLASLVALQLMLVTIGFTYSRGGLIVLILGLACFLALSGSALRLLAWLSLAVVATLPSVILGLTSHALTANGVPLGRRESAGLLLLVMILAGAVLLWLGGEWLLIAERRVVVTAGRRAAVVRALFALGGLGVLLVLAAVAASSRGFTGTFSHLWTNFTSTGGVSVSDPARLLSADSANRWVWWKEALGAFSSRPIAGWGAGSFPVVHLLFRHDTLTVQHPHSMPLQWLAELGLIGLILILGAWVLLLRSSFRTRSQATGPLRLLAAALLAAVLAYTVHMLYDWDWDMPGLTLPLFALFGALAGSLRPAQSPDAEPAGRPAGPVLRGIGVVLALAACCVFALSAVLPSVAASDAAAALVQASGSTVSALDHAQSEAAQASRLDPVSDAGPRAQAVVAEHRGDLPLARAYMLQAVRRQPSDMQAWASLAFLDALTHHPRQTLVAAQRMLELDPEDPSITNFAYALGSAAFTEETPARGSATRLATPADLVQK